MRRSRSPHVSHVTRADDEGNGPPEFMCHMWMHERPPPFTEVYIDESVDVYADAFDFGHNSQFRKMCGSHQIDVHGVYHCW